MNSSAEYGVWSSRFGPVAAIPTTFGVRLCNKRGHLSGRVSEEAAVYFRPSAHVHSVQECIRHDASVCRPSTLGADPRYRRGVAFVRMPDLNHFLTSWAAPAWRFGLTSFSSLMRY